MQITKAGFIAFAYTIKHNSGDPDKVCETHYEPIFHKWKQLGLELEYKIKEKDKQGRLHYHGILYLPKGFFRKRLMCKASDGKQYHIKLDEIFNRKGWIKYIEKDVKYNYLEDDYDHSLSLQGDEVITPKSQTVIPTKRMF